MADQEADVTPEGQVDDEENGDIDAGYTYAGQMIDHDLTLDNRPNDLTTPVDPRTLPNARTPAFDLDSVYGGGPTGSPQLYAADRMHLLLGAPLTGTPSDPGSVDMPRDPASGQALSGDPRDDENRIVAGLHTIMLRFHNEWVDRVKALHPRWSASQIFAEAQRQVRWHYQWAVLTDFLPTIVGKPALSAVFPRGVRTPRLSYYRPCAQGMPVEFSVAAYRFGHSMVRPIYRLNAAMPERLPVFASLSPDANDLGGFRPSPPGLSVDWRFFFNMEQPRRVGFPQASYKIDNSLVFPLSLLPTGAAGTGPTSLAVRNLLRGQQVGLPSGQAVARAMGIRPLRPDQILVGKATDDEADAEPISAIAPDLATSTPLWTYVLAETTATAYPVRGGEDHRPAGGPVPPRSGRRAHRGRGVRGPHAGGPRIGAPQPGLPSQRGDRPGRPVRLQGPDRGHDVERGRTGSPGDDARRRERGRRGRHRVHRAAPAGPAPLGRELVARDRRRPVSEAPRERGFSRARAEGRSCRARPGSSGAPARAEAAHRPSARTGARRPARPSGGRGRTRW